MGSRVDRALAVLGEQGDMRVITSNMTVPKALKDLGPAALPSLLSLHSLTSCTKP